MFLIIERDRGASKCTNDAWKMAHSDDDLDFAEANPEHRLLLDKSDGHVKRLTDELNGRRAEYFILPVRDADAEAVADFIRGAT